MLVTSPLSSYGKVRQRLHEVDQGSIGKQLHLVCIDDSRRLYIFAVKPYILLVCRA